MDNNGIINFSDSTSNMETADIFPAYKLVQMVYFLLLIYPMYQREHVSEKPDDCLLKYLNMVASYVAYMHLFNSSCGVRMEKTWNKAIGNEYVYITKEKVNVLEEEKNNDTRQRCSCVFNRM